MKRKGSLNLSIEAIVIVVIAFVVLGLGLGFVRNQFSSFGGIAGSVQEQIKQQVLDDLRTGDKKLSFPATEITLGKKESQVTAIGIKDTKSVQLNYRLEITQTGPKGDTTLFGSDLSDNFLYSQEVDSLEVTDTRVIPIRITSETASGTGQFKLAVYDVASDGSETLYDSKTFFITITG